jgi:HPt (histidine-containing phosphotransfer) domain-containing protein
MSEAVLDPAAFAHLLEITGDDLEFVDELVDTYFDDAVVQLEAMRQAAEKGDTDALVRPAHSLKSSSANVGAATLSEACRSLEADGRTGVVPDFAVRVADCEAIFVAVQSALLAERASR